MGIAEALLGKDNPFTQWVGQNQNFLGAIGAGLGQGQNIQSGLGAGLSMLPQAKQLDQAAAEKLKAEKLAETQANATQNWLQANHPDLAQMVQAGMPVSEAWQTAMQRMQPETTAQQNPYMNLGDGNLFNWQTGEYTSNPNAQPSRPDAPSGYQWGPDGNQVPVPGGPADPNNPLNVRRTGGGVPNATVMKEIFDADEGAQAGENVLKALDRADELNASAWDGPFADVRSAGAALFGNQDAVNTQELQNTVTANALESLRATFGGNPTEGERKILLEVQGSVNQPRAVREAIFKRARAAAKRRLAFNRERGSSLRSGGYFDEGYSPVGGGADPVSAADALLNSGKY